MEHGYSTASRSYAGLADYCTVVYVYREKFHAATWSVKFLVNWQTVNIGRVVDVALLNFLVYSIYTAYWHWGCVIWISSCVLTRAKGESMSKVWPTLGSRTAEKQNRLTRDECVMWWLCMIIRAIWAVINQMSHIHNAIHVFDTLLAYNSYFFVIFRIIRLHQMHEMQSILIDVCSICLSVCHVAHLGFTVQKWLNRSSAVWGEHSWGPMEHCVRHGSWSLPHREGEEAQFWILGPLLSSERLQLETWNFACIQRGRGPNENYTKVGHRGLGSPGLILNFGAPPPHISRTAEAADLKFCVRIKGWVPWRKLCESRPWDWGRWPYSEFWDPLLSPERLKLETWYFACIQRDWTLMKTM